MPTSGRAVSPRFHELGWFITWFSYRSHHYCIYLSEVLFGPGQENIHAVSCTVLSRKQIGNCIHHQSIFCAVWVRRTSSVDNETSDRLVIGATHAMDSLSIVYWQYQLTPLCPYRPKPTDRQSICKQSCLLTCGLTRKLFMADYSWHIYTNSFTTDQFAVHWSEPLMNYFS